MEIKIINVYYGQDLLPYKDVERQVHYPITSGVFLGASNTTKIRFYYDYIGDTASTYVSVAKLPNGKQGSQVLSKSSDENGNYAELELSNWYTQAKGDVYIALQGYSGGVEYSYDDETQLYEIHGTPTIQTTGSIKLAINYAPIGDSADYNDEFTTYQEILAALGDKVDKITTSRKGAYAHIGDSQLEIVVDNYATPNTIAQRVSGGHVNVGLTPTSNENATSKKYVDDSIASAISSVYKYKGSVATYNDLPSSDLTVGDVYNVEDTGDNYAWTGTTWDKLAGDVDLSSYYTKSDVDTLLASKQNTLVNQVNIKSINNQSLLGTGNIDIQGSGGGAWGEITGNIQDQTDLQNELTNIREVAEGKTKTYIVDYGFEVVSSNYLKYSYIDNGEEKVFSSQAELETWLTGKTCANSNFNSNNNSMVVSGATFVSFLKNNTNNYANNEYVFITVLQLVDILNQGDIILVVQTDVPDRWFAFSTAISSSIYILTFYKLETSKIDLTTYATKTDLAGVNSNIASEYSASNSYAIGEVVIYNGVLYRCTTAIPVAEAWDSTHWSQVSVASDFVNLTGTQTISGVKTFSAGICSNEYYRGDGTTFIRYSDGFSGANINGNFVPYIDNYFQLGWNTRRWTDLYLSGTIYAPNIDYGSGSLTLKSSGISKYNFTNWQLLTYASCDLGSSTYQWKDLYLSGKAYFGTSKIWSAGTNNLEISANGGNVYTIGNLRPETNNQYDLGANGDAWKDGYFSGQVYARNTFNVINASDITNNTLTADQLAIITNGKPTLISGTLLGYTNIFLQTGFVAGGYYRCYGFAANNYPMNCMTGFYINESTGVIAAYGQTNSQLALESIARLNGKPIPNYPADANWKGEWYGTQAQYDALASVDSNTTYYIIED